MRIKKLISTVFKQLTILFYSIFLLVNGFSQQKEQDYKFGNVTAKDFNISSSKIVTENDAAIILYEAGNTHFVGNKKGWFNYVYTCTRKIKIVNKRAFELATVSLELFKKDEEAEVLSDMKAVTSNLNNDVVTHADIDKDDIFTENEDKNHILKKFTLPAVKEGSIIEYTYTITSPYVFNMPSWQFQRTEYPVLWSEYKVVIPSTLKYVSIRQGFDSFYIKKSSEGYQTYSITQPADKGILGSQDKNLSVGAATSNFRWVEKDLLPLKTESFMSSPKNYIDKIEFQLAGTYNGEDINDVANTWQNASKEILKDEDFEKAVSNDNTWIRDLPENKDAQNNLQIARNIYYYIQNNYACTDTLNLFKETDLHDVYKKQQGSVRGINLLLVAMLNNKNIPAEPVLLSTRENGYINPNYPVINKFNYLICRAYINKKFYLLDASNTLLGFGKLSEKCYNGYARVINGTRSDSLYLSSDSLKEAEISTLFLNADADGTISGSYKCVMGEMQSAAMRKQMLEMSKDEYFKNIHKGYAYEVNVSNVTIDSLEQREMPVSIKYDISFKVDGDIIYFNPMTAGDMETQNPFKAAERTYPVEMPFRIDKTYILSMPVPPGYKIDELPKSARVSLNENEGMFEYLIQQTQNAIQLRSRIKLNKANFQPADYETLRNFFAYVIEKESQQIVFKKL